MPLQSRRWHPAGATRVVLGFPSYTRLVSGLSKGYTRMLGFYKGSSGFSHTHTTGSVSC